MSYVLGCCAINQQNVQGTRCRMPSASRQIIMYFHPVFIIPIIDNVESSYPYCIIIIYGPLDIFSIKPNQCKCYKVT